jgi:hypothetical protein
MANRIADCGVPQAANSDITVFPTITDLGVPVEGLVAGPNMPNRQTHSRRDVLPAARVFTALGVGVPYSPIHGTKID